MLVSFCFLCASTDSYVDGDSACGGRPFQAQSSTYSVSAFWASSTARKPGEHYIFNFFSNLLQFFSICGKVSVSSISFLFVPIASGALCNLNHDGTATELPLFLQGHG
jgi:hypothetical protein